MVDRLLQVSNDSIATIDTLMVLVECTITCISKRLVLGIGL